MTLVDAVVLGAIQGLTEFLPVSSSGHLVMGREFLGLRGDGDISFEMILHAGTLLSVFVVMARELRGLTVASKKLFTPSSWREAFGADADFRMLVYIVIGTVPAAIAGLLLRKEVERTFGDPRFTAKMFLVTAGLLFVAAYCQRRAARLEAATGPERKADSGGLTLLRSLIVGVAQACAIFPGISRSGSTISAALASGVNGKTAGTYSFYLSIPVIVGAILLELPKIVANGESFAVLATGFLTAFVTGVAAFRWLLVMLRSGRIWYFGLYLVAAGLSYLFLFHRS
jgi:undecaprenyl-diphosphatase